jgi:hypothetical protein
VKPAATAGAALLLPVLWGAPALFAGAPQPGISLPPGVLGPDDRFGSAVAVGDGVVAVGAYLSGAGEAGAVYLFHARPAGNWSPVLPPLTLTGGPGDWFGFDVAIDGACLLVGAPRAPGASRARTGAAYLYDLSVLLPDLKGPCRLPNAGKRLPIAGGDGDGIGSAVAVSGSTWAVGARGDGQAGPGAGSVYVHQEGQVDQKLVPDQPAQGAEFGQSVSLDGDLLAVGAPLAEVAGEAAGAVYLYLFDRGQGGWKPSGLLSAPRAGDAFGYAVAVNAKVDEVVVGAPLDGSQGDDAGAAYLYHRVAGVWQQPGQLDAGALAGDQFGVAVAFDRGGEHEIVAGARRAGSHQEGAAYLFNSEGLVPTALISPNPRAGAEFGFSAAIHAGTLVIGAFLQQGGGAAYLFAPAIPPPHPMPQKVTVQWEAPSVTVAESAGAVRLPVVVKTDDGLPTAAKVTVRVAAVDGTAGSHFRLSRDPLTIPAGQSGGEAVIPIVQDLLCSDEIFRVALTNPTGAVLGTPSEEVITLRDDDPAGLAITLANPPRLVTTDEGGADHFAVALISQPCALVVVNFTGAAGNGRLSPELLVFTPADWNRPQTVTITGVEDPGCVADTATRYVISVTTSSGDRRYAALSPPAAPTYHLAASNRHLDRTDIVAASGTVCAYPDGTVFYTLVLTNQGECALEEVAGTSLVERLPWDELIPVSPATEVTGLTLVAAASDRGSAAVDLVANAVRWSGAIPPQAQATITFVAAQTGAPSFPPAGPQGDLTYASRPGGPPDTLLHLDPSVFIAGTCP